MADAERLLPTTSGVNQRAMVRMTEAEIDAYLALPHAMTLSTHSPDGDIHSTAMWYGYVDGTIYLETKRKSQKAQNLLRDPRLTCLVHGGTVYAELQGVMITGTARIAEAMDDEELLRSVITNVFRRYTGEQPEWTDVAGFLRKRIIIEVCPKRIASWDHRKVQSATGPH